MKQTLLLSFFTLLFCFTASAQNVNTSKFKQLGHELSTPNVYRTASGAPGSGYWQQKADYKIKIRLDDENQKIYGEEEICYFNNSPDPLNYIWIQLDQNMRSLDSDTRKTQTASFNPSQRYSFNAYQQRESGQVLRLNEYQLSRLHSTFDGGFKIDFVKDQKGLDLHYIINNTMMRIDLPEVLAPGKHFCFQIKWWYNINDRMKDGGGRSGMEYFEENDNYIYTIAQFYPRMAVYSDFQGWQNKQFLGRGEFTLCFGDFHVEITVPEDHQVAATGILHNMKTVLSSEQYKRYQKAKTANKPTFIVNPKEAVSAEKSKADGEKTWIFEAENVRDFAFASSRKFIWDAMGVKFGDRTVMAMSMYPKEGNPLWEHYSTRVVAHTIKTYSKYTFDYPYPVAWSVHTKQIGMEYPMICFNGGRPDADGTYSESTKYSMLGVIIHEVGHNYFPMIVNSDERQWTWMDEGLNTFLQGVAEREWDADWPNFTGNPKNIVYYMGGDPQNMSPIMTNSESIRQFNANAYQKPATALNILRETVMGRELFDFAFKQYAQRWMFKHPTPEDFFRTMEDASAVDLDWFWRGWFFTTDHVDLSIESVKHYVADYTDPLKSHEENLKTKNEQAEYIYFKRNREEGFITAVEKDSSLHDFYTDYDDSKLDKRSIQQFKMGLENLPEELKATLDKGYHYYEIAFKNIGGLVMPLVVKFNYTDGSEQVYRIPAEIWRTNTEDISKIFILEKEVDHVILDPYLECADTDMDNNYWPRKRSKTRFQTYKANYYRGGGNNPMRDAAKKK